MSQVEQEPDVVPSRGVLISLVATLATIALCTLVAWAIEVFGGGAVAARPAPAVPTEASAMERTLFDERAQGLESHDQAEHELGAYGWIDRERGIIHIPIDVAIDLTIARQEAAR